MNEYRIVMQCWNPEATKVKSGRSYQEIFDHVGGVARYAKYRDDDNAKQAAREVWSENYTGAMKQIKIYRGVELVHESDNFQKFVK
jgi:hypothetical protein